MRPCASGTDELNKADDFFDLILPACAAAREQRVPNTIAWSYGAEEDWGLRRAHVQNHSSMAKRR
jgi:hypothetical protein